MAPHRPVIGGPGSVLPCAVESFLSWSFCFTCLSITAYHYISSIYVVPSLLKMRSIFSLKKKNGLNIIEYYACWIPLTTHSQSELARFTPLERYNQLLAMLQYHGLSLERCKRSDGRQKEKMIEILRENTICRRLASLAFRPMYIDHDGKKKKERNSSCQSFGLRSSSILDQEPPLPLAHELASIWSSIIELPNPPSACSGTKEGKVKSSFRLTVVIPAYNETGQMLKKHMLRLLDRCENTKQIEIIVVDAGGGRAKDDLQNVIENFQNLNATDGFGCVRLLQFTKGGGRGACLNYGAAEARGDILTFCHLDIYLPPSWDQEIYHNLNPKCHAKRANACAFDMGIDSSSSSSSPAVEGEKSSYYPPGIRAVEKISHVRANLFSLPYGDQTISIHKYVFDFLGGFPDQCLMEDYEFSALLRKRAALLGTEELKIIRGAPAVCSARRWQKFGVMYVTYMNYKVVNLYNGGMGPDDVYELYYGQGPPKRDSDLSPWEIEMDALLQTAKE